MLELNTFHDIVKFMGEAILVAKPIKIDETVISDFEIIFTNESFQSLTKTKFLSDKKLLENLDLFAGELSWKEIATNAYNNEKISSISFYSESLDSWFSLSMSRLPEDLLLITIHNVSISKEHETQLKRQNERLSALSEELVLSRQNLRVKLEKIETLNTELENMAYNDLLTGLPNRMRSNEVIKSLVLSAKESNQIIGIMLIDIDDMKNINDTLGNACGDSLLVKTSDYLKKFERETIKVFRYGGDEFLLVATDLASKDTMITISDTVLEVLNANDINASIGISVYPDDSENIDELLKYADMAMQDVKKSGKNDILFFQNAMKERFLCHLSLETKLSKALDAGKFQLYYQPQVDITTKKLRGFEALIRWYDEELGWISPEKFIPIAEESKIVIPIGDWVLETALKTLSSWQDSLGFSGIMSINISPLQLKKPTFLEDLQEIIAKYRINPSSVEIEITEGVLIENLDDTVKILNCVKNMGIAISLDDFGTGYSSLSYLQILPLNTLKIDKSFIANISSRDSVEADITDSIISMVTKMGLDTIAEGVENKDQLNVLEKIHCKNTQGFLMGMPMPVDLCERMLKGDESAILRNVTNEIPIRYSI